MNFDNAHPIDKKTADAILSVLVQIGYEPPGKVQPSPTADFVTLVCQRCGEDFLFSAWSAKFIRARYCKGCLKS